MFAAFDLNTSGTEVTRIGRDAIKRDTLEIENEREPELKRVLWVDEIFDSFSNGVKLPEAVADFSFCFFRRSR
jgi:hypothetical protein